MLITNLLQLNICYVCRIDLASKLNLCDFCRNILPWIKNNKYLCNKCQKPLLISESLVCQQCLTTVTDFNKILAIFNYQMPIKQFILDLKFREKLAYGKFLGKILADQILNNWYKNQPLPETIIPMPLHPKRLRSRGFNQALELTKTIDQNIPVNLKAATRIKNTVNQASLSKIQRNPNIKHAFVAQKLPYQHIAIVDDIITTGNTMRALCKAIKAKNPKIIIDLWCIARA
jgi:ComF family protein